MPILRAAWSFDRAAPWVLYTRVHRNNSYENPLWLRQEKGLPEKERAENIKIKKQIKNE